MNIFGPLKPSTQRNRTLRQVYEDWKKKTEPHWSMSGMTAEYIAYRAVEEGIPFTLETKIEQGQVHYFILRKLE